MVLDDRAVQKNGWMLCIASDITSLRAHGRTVRQDRDQAIKASYTDELTGVANRRFVMARVDDMLATASTETTDVLPSSTSTISKHQ
ncbi:hypothetical protein [Rhizobium leguminosarum]|uniref:hypothetical protein n=1 Tax=Rhizobium leguminosarum TaxID=384 RepID=UPI003A90AEF2